VRVTIVDSETGAPLPSNSLRISFHESNSTSSEYELAADGTASAEEGVIKGLPSGEPFTLMARVSGRPRGLAILEPLLPAEERAVTIEIPRGSSLAGRVAAKEPLSAAGVSIKWTRGPRAGYEGKGSMSDHTGKVPNVDSITTSDSEGNFFIDGIEPGQHTLRARWSPWLYVDRTLTHPLAEGQELVLEAPLAGFLEGRLLLPEGRGIEDVRLSLKPESDRGAWFRSGREDPGGQLRSDGRFEYGPLPAGSIEVYLVVNVSGGRSSTIGSSFPLGDVMIGAGSTTLRDWDVRDMFPGGIRPRVTIDGEPAVDGWLAYWTELEGTGLGGGTRSLEEKEPVLEGLRPGEWHLAVVGSDGSRSGRAWFAAHPGVTLVSAAETTDVTIAVTLYKRSLRFTDAATGEPIADQRVGWTSVVPDALRWLSQEPPGSSATTNSSGGVTLSLPAGDVRFFRGDQAGDKSIIVDWAALGDEAVIRLP